MSKTNKISIVGTNGVGKTVFVTVWSKSLEKQEQGKPFIVPTPQTYAYIERNWLQRLKKGVWPESTPQSEFIELKWTLKTPNGTQSEISVCDLAGHDLRRLYAGDEPKISDDVLKTIYDSIESANIILLIVNLKDFTTVDDALRIENTTNLLSMLNHFFSTDKNVAMLFSQWHEYEAWVNQMGGLDKVLEMYMPAVQNACILHGNSVKQFTVSAVVETLYVLDSDGMTTVQPDPNFTSKGLERLNKWVTESIDDATNYFCFNIGGLIGSHVGIFTYAYFYMTLGEVSVGWIIYLCIAGIIGWVVGTYIDGALSKGRKRSKVDQP